MPVLAKGLEEGVSGAVVALARLVDERDEGGGHKEEVEFVVEERVVEVPGAVDFGGDGGGPFQVGHVEDWVVSFVALS